MREQWRPYVTAALLVAVSALLTWTGVVDGLWSRLTLVDPWRGDLAGDESPATEEVRQRETILRLNAENAALRARLQEYSDIRGETGVPTNQTVLLRAPVLARSQRRGNHYWHIGAGAIDGVQRDLAVTVGASLVGIVAGEAAGRSLVRVITDRDSRIPAQLISTDAEGGSRVVALGVAAGTGERTRFELAFVEDHDDLVVTPGMAVVTAGGPASVPPGLVLGAVVSAAREDDSDHWAISCEPVRALGNCSSVLVLRAPKVAR